MPARIWPLSLALVALVSQLAAPAHAAPASVLASSADIEPPSASPDAASTEARSSARWYWLGGVVGGYALIGGASYMAWYHGTASHGFELADDGWFGADTYAGGADKLGHFYSNMLLTRGMAGVLRHGGFSRGESIVFSAGLSTLFHLGVELKDAYYFGFSFGDLTANLLGTSFGAAMTWFPALDRAIDVRIEYWPSSGYVNEVEHGGSWNSRRTTRDRPTTWPITSPRSTDWPAAATPALPATSISWEGFAPAAITSGRAAPGAVRRRRARPAAGAAQRVRRAETAPVGAGRTARQVAEFATEVYSVPFTTLPIADADRRGTPITE